MTADVNLAAFGCFEMNVPLVPSNGRAFARFESLQVPRRLVELQDPLLSAPTQLALYRKTLRTVWLRSVSQRRPVLFRR